MVRHYDYSKLQSRLLAWSPLASAFYLLCAFLGAFFVLCIWLAVHEFRTIRYAPGFSPSKWRQIAVGMSQPELIALVGQPMEAVRKSQVIYEYRRPDGPLRLYLEYPSIHSPISVGEAVQTGSETQNDQFLTLSTDELRAQLGEPDRTEGIRPILQWWYSDRAAGSNSEYIVLVDGESGTVLDTIRR